MPELRLATYEPLLVTKMQPPSFAPLLSRPRLLQRLEASAALTLITAPAGCGKTALLCDWASHTRASVAWLTLHSIDNNAHQFVLYICSALGVEVDTESPEAMLVTLLNSVALEAYPYILLLDNYHAITHPDVHEAVTFLLDHLPPNLRVIIAGRTLPPLPLARLRVQGKLTHLHAADLALQADEVTNFLHLHDVVDSHDSALLDELQGWAAGLQLLALAHRESDDAQERTLRARQYIREYVVQEVLSVQPPDVQSFLLHSAVLDTLTPALCDALTNRYDSRAILQSLVDTSLFTHREGEQTYRYAPFFRAALYEHFALTFPVQMAEVLERATSSSVAPEPVESSTVLSEREQEVLVLLADGLSSPQIAQRMIIAVSTVKTHLKHIYRKLNVDNRYQALNRARELNLLQIEMEGQMRRMMR